MRHGFGFDPFEMQAIFLLVAVDRDDEAYNLIKYSQKHRVDQDCSEVTDSNKGDWMYLTGQDKTENFYDGFGNNSNEKDGIAMDFVWDLKLALIAIKMKTINAMGDKIKLFDYFDSFLAQAADKSLAKKVAILWPVMDSIQTYVLGYKRSDFGRS
jgi:hypothetical protein